MRKRASAATKPSVVRPKKAARIKVISLGHGGAGKSCLIKRYCEEKFVSRYISTIGVDFGVKPVMIEGKEFRVNFWDLSGHPEFFEVRNEFYRDTQGIMLVCDTTNPKSFDSLDDWLREASKYGADLSKVKVVLCANKIDLKKSVRIQDIRAWAEDNGIKMFETSAYTGENVSEMFESLFREVSTAVT